MTGKMILVSVMLALGALLLGWGAIASRGEPEAKAPRSTRTVASPRRLAQPETPAPSSSLSAEASPSVPDAAPPTEAGVDALIHERIRKMEARVRELEARRDGLTLSNQDLERQVAEKSAEFSARYMAEARVRGWESLLGLSESQKQSLIEIWTKWLKEDAGRPPTRDAWLAREVETRSRLTVEQSAKLHETAALQGQQLWSRMGQSIGGMVGASKEDQLRFQQMLGDYRAPNAMILPEAYGADWPGLLRDASARLGSLLSADQTAKLGRFVRN